MLLCQPQFTGVLCPRPSFQATFRCNPSCWYQLQGLCARCFSASFPPALPAFTAAWINKTQSVEMFLEPMVSSPQMAGWQVEPNSCLAFWSGLAVGCIYRFLPRRLKLKPGTCMDMAESLDNIKHTGPKVVTMYDNDSFTFMQSTIANYSSLKSYAWHKLKWWCQKLWQLVCMQMVTEKRSERLHSNQQNAG